MNNNTIKERINIDSSFCTGCRVCEKNCPTKSISMNYNAEGFLYPTIDYSTCVKCGICLSCIKRTKINKISESECYAAYSMDKNERKSSASGGVFYCIAKKFIKEGGVVFGAVFDDSFSVVHKSAETIQELNKIAGSKYIQSDVLNTYSEVEELLKNGRKVLYSGTPCQISGLKKYLKKSYKDLFCVSLICHGVASVKVWIRFIDELKKDLNEDYIKAICFRKKYGKRQFFEIETNNCIYALEDVDFVKGYKKDYYLRYSCYDCPEKNGYSEADLILGDFWGVEAFDKKLSMINFVNACLLITAKGKELFKKTKNIEKRECSYEDILRYNPSLERSSSTQISVRDYFFSNYLKETKSLSDCIFMTEKYEHELRKKNNKEETMSTPKRFVNIKQNSQIVLWGTGECYKRNIKEILKKVKPAFVCDNDKQKWGSMIGGLKCVQPQKIKEIKTPFIVIMIDNPAIALEVAGQIMDMEIYTFDIFSNWEKYANDFIRVVKKG